MQDSGIQCRTLQDNETRRLSLPIEKRFRTREEENSRYMISRTGKDSYDRQGQDRPGQDRPGQDLTKIDRKDRKYLRLIRRTFGRKIRSTFFSENKKTRTQSV
jgi:hypothetical protein